MKTYEKTVKSKLMEKYKLFTLGKTFRDKFYLLKYSIVHHAKKIGYKIPWKEDDIIINIRVNKKEYKIHTKDSIYFTSVFREIFSEKQYKPIEKIDGINTVLDLGANTGLFTIYANSYHNDAQFICIEPEDINYTLLTKNIQNNNINGIALKKAIVADNVKNKVKIFKSTSPTGFSMHDNYTDNEDYFEVESISLDDIFNLYNLDTIDLLKCDIEGAEKELFKRISDEVQKKIKYIILEYHSEEIKDIIMNALKEQFNIINHNKLKENNLGILFFMNKNNSKK